MNRLVLVAPVAAGLLVGAVLAPEGGDNTVLEGPKAHAYALDEIASHTEGLDFLEFADTYEEALPNQLYEREDGSQFQLSKAFVAGTVAEVRPRAAYLVAGKDADTGQLTSFDDANARWRVVELVVETDVAVGATEGDETVTVGLAVPGTTQFESFRNGLVGHEVVAPLSGQGFFKDDEDLWNIARGDTLLGFVQTDGTLEFPFLEMANSEWSVPQSVEEVSEILEETPPVIETEVQNGIPVPVS